MNTIIFQCHKCGSQHFNFGVSYGSIFYLICTHARCHAQYKFDTSSGFSVLTHVNGAALAPQQEPAVQVPATAPAAGHLSTETVDK